ncbi:MAG: mucoidy inhibitor MuiA family protein [Planctomycetes bacterium]|nr:mucoidy inhibitor MuiA family protein [Planctomycetota bacterium]
MTFALVLAALAADPVPLDSRIADVTVYPSTALVRRAADVSGPGSYVLRGLPRTLDTDSVRVRSDRGAVVSVEVKLRLQEAAPSERVEALRQRLVAAEREVRVAADRVASVNALGAHLQSLMKVDADTAREEVRAGRASPESWESAFGFFGKKLADLSGERREAERDLEAKQNEVRKLQAEIGRWTSAAPEPVHDVLVDLEGAGAAKLEVQYLVQGTGWQPAYELRAAQDLTKVALTYRARVFQASGEDWNDVALSLSTAEPQRGAQGPEPRPVWLSLWQPPPAAPAPGSLRKGRALTVAAEAERADAGNELGLVAQDKFSRDDEQAFAATIQSAGLSVRYQLQRRETVTSRSEPTSVLVGGAELSVDAERTVVPALDTTVWLTGRARNTSEYTLLPGVASVFLGQDFLGRASLPLVQPGAELTLHLGADPYVQVERNVVQDLEKGPGFLSSTSSKVEGWRVTLKNHGAPSAAKDGAVEVVVREVLPRTRDERIAVELTKAEPKVSTDERWKQDREEKGILTWVVRVPKGGAPANVVWESTIRFPKGERVVRE